MFVGQTQGAAGFLRGALCHTAGMTIRLNRHRCMTALFSLALGLSAAVLPISRLEAQQEADRQGSMPICNCWPPAHGGRGQRSHDQSMTTGLTYNPRVIQLDRSQPGASTTTTPPAFTPIASNMSTPLASRGGGRSMPALLAMQGGLRRAMVCRCRYCWPFGAETDYGAAKGGFDLAGSLATWPMKGVGGNCLPPNSSPCSKWWIAASRVRN
jgi:membrane-bound lytic murein transglycosylase B